MAQALVKAPQLVERQGIPVVRGGVTGGELDRSAILPLAVLPFQPLHVQCSMRGVRFGEVWIELKALPGSSNTTLLSTIDHAPLPERCAVHSFDHRIVARLGAQRPGLRRGVLSTSYPVDPISPLRAAGSSALWQEWHLIDAPLVDAVHRAGGEIIAWTVNEPESAGRLAELGVDAVCGNWPDRLRSG